MAEVFARTSRPRTRPQSRHDPSPTGGPAGPRPRYAGRGSVLRRPVGRAGGRGDQGRKARPGRPVAGPRAFRRGPDGPYSLYWAVEGRGRKSVTLDLSHPEGQRVFRDLATRSDVLCENFRPGTLERWNIDRAGSTSASLRSVSVSFGQDGPKLKRPGLDRNGVAYGGLLHLTGEEGRPPVRPGVTVTDYLTALFAAPGGHGASLRTRCRRDRSGRSNRLPTSTGRPCESSSGPLPPTTASGRSDHAGATASTTPRHSTTTPAATDATCASWAPRRSTSPVFVRPWIAPSLSTTSGFVNPAARAANNGEINAIVAAWVAQRDADEVERRCVEHGRDRGYRL